MEMIRDDDNFSTDTWHFDNMGGDFLFIWLHFIFGTIAIILIEAGMFDFLKKINVVREKKVVQKDL